VVGAGTVIVLALAAWVIGSSESVQWAAIPEYMVNPLIFSGILLTLELTFAAMAIGIVLGAVVAAMSVGDNLVLKAIAAGFVWVFRGIPLIVQVFFWFNIALFVPKLGWGDYQLDVNQLVTPLVAGLLALGLHEAGNMAEVIRSGLLSVDKGQHEACRALGFTKRQTLLNIIVPQALRVIVPPTGNQAIGMLKASAIVSVIGMEDLLTQAQHIYARNFLVIELLCVASLWYLILTTIASIGQFYLERYFNRGFERKAARPTVTGGKADE
jgi:polar amino acid transport system permease protein